ncbi:hypothetical protein FKM82_024170 [Ascaphus truei]
MKKSAPENPNNPVNRRSQRRRQTLDIKAYFSSAEMVREGGEAEMSPGGGSDTDLAHENPGGAIAYENMRHKAAFNKIQKPFNVDSVK